MLRKVAKIRADVSQSCLFRKPCLTNIADDDSSEHDESDHDEGEEQ